MRIRHLVKTSGAVIMASAMIQPVFSTMDMAAMASAYQPYPTHLYIDGVLVSSPKHIVAKDPWGKKRTSWVPIYYLQQGLNQNGVESTWNGRDLTLIPPSGWTVKQTSIPQPRALQKGQMDFMVDGTQFAIAPTIVTADPASGIQTTYIPIYYAKQFLSKRFGMQVTWDGVNWLLNSPSVLLPQSKN